MRLLYITNQVCGSGGLERVLSIKASYLADKLGYDVHMVTLNQKGEPLFYDFSSKIKFHDLTVGGNAIEYIKSYKNEMRHIVAQLNPDVISVCDDGLKGFFLPLILKKPCAMVYERHVSKNIEVQTEKPGLFKRLKTKITFGLMHFAGSKFDRFVVLTQENLKEWDLKNLQVISNPLSFYPETVSTLANKKVLAVGRLDFQKGYDRLLESWSQIQPKYPEWKLDVFGKIDAERKYIKQARRLSLDQSVAFHEPVKNIQEKYEAASVYVMPSRFEGFGMVLIEAMAFGVPCVSFDCPYGPGDIISEGKDGFLVTNGDTATFAKRIMQLMADMELRRRMGVAARKKARSYMPENIVPQWDSLFKELAGAA